MSTIKINTQDGNWELYDSKYPEWKSYVRGEDFDEVFVIAGNRDFNGVKEASWYLKAKKMLEDFDYEMDRVYYDDLTDEQYDKIKQIYDDCSSTDDLDTIAEVLKVLYPTDVWETATIRGYCQDEWQDVLFKANAVDDSREIIDCLEAFYFGKIASVCYTDDDDDSVWDYIADDELWDLERDYAKLEKEMRERFSIDDDESLKIFISDGVITTTNWKQIS